MIRPQGRRFMIMLMHRPRISHIQSLIRQFQPDIFVRGTPLRGERTKLVRRCGGGFLLDDLICHSAMGRGHAGEMHMAG